MEEPKPTCSICAWRATCNKKFSVIDPSRCVDYTRDISIKIEEKGKKKDEDKDRNRD